jgi:uncharacterized RDD family membrane protein YckC
MSWQTPGSDPPPDPASSASPAEPVGPESDAETARVPIAPPPTPGLISAAPVGWVGPAGGASTGGQTGGPEVAWAAPAAAAASVATIAEGLVIAGVFSRLVAYVIDVLLLGLANLAVGWLLGINDPASNQAIGLAVSLVFVGVEALYFVGLWRSGGQATIGMRLLGLRLLGAVDARTIALQAAVIRWLAVSGITSIIALVGVGGGVLGLVSLVWVFVLLLTTATNPLRQGLHDRWAGSVIVQPAPGGSGAAVVGCLVLVFLAFALPFVVLVLANDRIQEILSKVGSSI